MAVSQNSEGSLQAAFGPGRRFCDPLPFATVPRPLGQNGDTGEAAIKDGRGSRRCSRASFLRTKRSGRRDGRAVERWCLQLCIGVGCTFSVDTSPTRATLGRDTTGGPV